MPQLGKLFLDVSLLARQLNFPPDHAIVGMGYDQQKGGYLIVGGPSLPISDGYTEPQEIMLETTFFGNGFAVPQAAASDHQQIRPKPPFPF